MTNWNIQQNLRETVGQEWHLLAELALTSQVHVKRKAGFLLSRMALLECLRERGMNVKPLDLVLENFSQIKKFPHLTISLSHTNDYGAALVSESSEFRSVGIDIEQEARVVSKLVRTRILHPDDQRLRNIELWCLKEAAFKALMNTGIFNAPFEFSSIRIGNGEWSHSPSYLSGKWELEIIKEVVMARAFLLN